MTRRLVAIVLVAFALAACGTREIAALERERDRLRVERDKGARIAEHLDEYKVEVARLQEDLGRVHEMGVLYTHEQRAERAGTVPGVKKSAIPGIVGWELSGTSRETFALLRRQAASLASEEITVDAAGWKIKVPGYDYVSIPSSAGVQIPPPTPPPSRFTSPISRQKSRTLRSEIESLQKEIAELERIVSEVQSFETKKGELTAYLALLNTPTRLGQQGNLAMDLFLDDGAPCRTGSLTLSRESVRLFCAPHTKNHEATVTAIRALFATDGAAWRLGPVSIDDRAPEPIQASFTHKP